MLRYKIRVLKATHLIAFFLCFTSCMPLLLLSQVNIQSTDVGLHGEPTGYVFYGTGQLSDKIPYGKIKGTPFWNNEWQLASLYNGSLKTSTKLVRLNLATNEIHFLENGKEYVLTGTNVSLLAFHKQSDTSMISSVFRMQVPNLMLHNKKLDYFVQVLNNGEYQLLKYVKRTVNSADSLFGTQKRYFFTDQEYYFLHFNKRIHRIKRLNKENVVEFLPSAASYSTWIEKNGIDFKNEADVIRFLDHYNAAHSNKE